MCSGIYGIGVQGSLEVAAGIARGAGHRSGYGIDDLARHLRTAGVVEKNSWAAQGRKLTANARNRKRCHFGPFFLSCLAWLCLNIPPDTILPEKEAD